MIDIDSVIIEKIQQDLNLSEHRKLEELVLTLIAFITGITGQDGSYLTELLLAQGYEVHGAVRRTSALQRSRLAHLYADPMIYERRLFLHYTDLDDTSSLWRLLIHIQPSELYHLAGQSHVGLSFEIPESTCELTAMGTLRLPEMIRDLPKPGRLFHATSSEIFGRPREAPQTELTPLAPVNPYGCAKAVATQMVRIYREAHGLFAVNGILYNHESPHRGENFVTRKICGAAAAIKSGHQTRLRFGDLNACRDWGHARDYVLGMWLALQHELADAYVFASGQLHSVRDVLETAFDEVGLNWHDHVDYDLHQIRPAEPKGLVGDATKARTVLSWEPETSFPELIREMTRAELAMLSQ